MVYKVYATNNFEKTFYRRHKHRKEWLISIMKELEQNPKIGKPLSGRLNKTWQLRIGPFRVWYEIHDAQNIIILKEILHKDEAKRLY